jgi:serine/threonine-protein kinase
MAAQPPPRPSAPRPGGASGPSSSSHSGSAPRGAKDTKQPGTFFLGRYRVVDEIGVGGMASVHLARMDGPGGFQKWVAIKRIHPHLVEDDQFVDMFLDEARIAAGINHANVAQVFDLGKDDNTYWIAMEYLHGEPLREIMRRAEDRRQLVGPELAARICADAAEGLHAAHELRGKNGQLLGLVHRDVTPHNLFVTYEGYTKVVDFGIAKVADRLSSTRAGTLKGKLAYMSPEQVRGAEVDRTTDIFALGVVLWELTTGHRLFRMDTDLDTLEKVQACVVPPPSQLVQNYPVELESVVMKALAKRKQDRFQTARELSRALQGVLMRRGAFVGPEEVANYVRALFGDRIQKREAHLAWAAEVTSTINVDKLRAGHAALPGSAEELSLRSYSDGQAPAPPPGPRSGSMPAVRPAGPPLAPPPPTAPPMAQMASTSLMDDDEDVPTTVATREHLEAAVSRAPAAPAADRAPPRPAAGMPAAGAPAVAAYSTAGSPYGAAPPGYAPTPPSVPPAGDERTQAFPAGGAAPEDLNATVALPHSMAAVQSQLAEAERARQQQQQQQQQQTYQPYAQPPQQPMGAPPGYGPQGYGAPPQGYGFPPGPQQAPTQAFPMMPPGAMGPQSQVETAISLPRPDAAALWLAQQEAAQRAPRKNTGVLIAVGLLTALCVAGIGALVYIKARAPSTPSPAVAESAAAVAPPAPTALPTATASAATEPSASASAEPSAAPTASASAAPSVAPATPPPSTAAERERPVAAAPPPTPAPAKEEPGYLTIVCTPFCDEVSDGGRGLGPSPIVHIAVKPGQHRITLKRSGKTKVISVIVVSGQVTAQRVSMK